MSGRFISSLLFAACLAGPAWPSPAVGQELPRQAITISVPKETVPRGRFATIAYESSGPVAATVEILTPKGDVVRTISTGAAATGGVAVWDTRFDGPDVLDEPEPGPLAPPGSYRVRVTAGGELREEVLKVGPAEGATPATAEDYSASLDLAVQVRSLQTRVNNGLRDVRREQQRLRDTLTPGYGYDRAAARLVEAGRIEDLLMGAPQRRGQAPDERSINGRLAALAADVARLDGRPSEAILASFAELDEATNAALKPTPADVSILLDAPDPSASITFDAKGVEFGPWLRRFIAQMKRNWLIPMAVMAEKGHVVFGFYVHKNGRITDIEMLTPSRVSAFNRSAQESVRNSNPTDPLPPKYPADKCYFCVTFYYNETPPGK
jgi:TonB family protein